MRRTARTRPAAVDFRRWRLLAAASATMALGTMLLAPSAARAADEIDIGHAPVFVLQGVDPNLVFTLDDSSSMTLANGAPWFNTPAYDGSDTSSRTNTVYYDPAVVYMPPLDAAGDVFGHADFTRAPRDFYTNQMACSASCENELLSGQAAVASCAALCGERTACTLDLGTHYAPLWYEDYEPCSELSDTNVPQMHQSNREQSIRESNRYSVDREHPAFVAPTDGSPIGTDDGFAWALRCMYDLLPDGGTVPVAGAAAIDDCPAFYHVLDATLTYKENPGSSVVRPCSDLVAGLAELQPEQIPASCLKRVVVSSDQELTLTDAAVTDERRRLLEEPGKGLTDAQLAERNFANWYAFYRTRWRTLQASISRVVSALDPSVRVAYQGMEQGATEPGTAFYDKELLPSYGAFDLAARKRFIAWLFGRRPTPGTFLLSSALRVNTFCSSDVAYAKDPDQPVSDDNPLLGCRNNFHLLFTDGDWTDDFASPVLTAPGWLGNNDGTATDLPEDRAFANDFVPPIDTYSPLDNPSTRIFADSNTGGLADIAFYSWITDLRPDENGDSHRVRTLIWKPAVAPGGDPEDVFWNPANDPADWQHVTTYTVGFGVRGNVSYPDGSYLDQTKNIATDGFPGNWSSLGGNVADVSAADKVDDLWHAGLNGRGGYSRAQNPATLIDTFRTVMDDVSSLAGLSAVAAPAYNTVSAGSDKILVQATLNTADWIGDLRAFRISGGIGRGPCASANVPRGDLCEDPQSTAYWSAAKELDAASKAGTPRRVLTTAVRGGSGGGATKTVVDFAGASWDELGSEQQRALLTGIIAAGADVPDVASPEVLEAKARMDYLAGERTYESSVRAGSAAYEFRDRASLLGDIINSSPVIVGPPSRFYLADGYSYKDSLGAESFKQQYADRPELVYAGANDGLLHAFDATSGEERFAYVPPVLFGKLWELTDPAYGAAIQHDNFVDGPIAEGDAWFGGHWHTVLVSALGRGAQALFALDVSNPIADGTTSGTGPLPLWQFTDADDADLGYVFGKPAIVRIRNPASQDHPLWVAIFGNGYSNAADDGHRATGCDDTALDSGSTACGRAVLYVVDIADGRLLAKLDTGVGRADDPNHSTAADQLPNGLGQPTVIGRTLAADGDLLADFAYAGDLFGNLWRFDLTNLGNTPVRVFSASYEPTDDSSVGQPAAAQPITAPVTVAAHPTGVGTIVLFGTGRYLGLSDVSDHGVQSFYGIWDRGDVSTGESSLPVPRVSRADLVRQELLHTDIQVTAAAADGGAEVSRARTSSRNMIDWGTDSGWYIDLSIDRDSSGENKGERVTSAAQVRGNRVIFVSMVPEGNPCLNGGYSWVNALAYASGAALAESPFDFNLDGSYGLADLLAVGDEPPAAGTSLRLTVAGNDTGIYSPPAVLPLAGGDVRTLVSTSEGDLIDLRESPVLEWRVWGQLR